MNERIILICKIKYGSFSYFQVKVSLNASHDATGDKIITNDVREDNTFENITQFVEKTYSYSYHLPDYVTRVTFNWSVEILKKPTLEKDKQFVHDGYHNVTTTSVAGEYINTTTTLHEYINTTITLYE